MKTKIPLIILFALLLQPANAEEPEKVMVELQRVVVSASAAQHKGAVFAILHSNGMGFPRIREEDTNQIIVNLPPRGISTTMWPLGTCWLSSSSFQSNLMNGLRTSVVAVFQSPKGGSYFWSRESIPRKS
jgi:hypothetical protein